jgi:cold shock CspA family protein
MREQGVICTWFRRRGFGLVAPDAGGADVFVLAAARDAPLFRPRIGQRVSYILVTDDKTGRLRAQHVQVVDREVMETVA